MTISLPQLILCTLTLILFHGPLANNALGSSTEAEYHAVASTTAELLWLKNLFIEICLQLSPKPVIYCDNLGATYVTANPVFHSKMKHLGLDYHFVRENVQSGSLRVSFISTHDQVANLLTKPLPWVLFQKFVNKIGLLPHKPILREM